MKRIIILFLSAFSLAAYSQKKYVIEGKIEGLPEGAIATLDSRAYEDQVIFDEEKRCEIIDGYFKIEGEEKPLSEVSYSSSISIGKLRIPLSKKHKTDGNHHRYWLRITHKDLQLFTGVFISVSGKKKTKVQIEGSIDISPKEWKIKSNLKDQQECNRYFLASYDLIERGYELYRQLYPLSGNRPSVNETDSIQNLSDSVNHLRYALEIKMMQEKSKTDFNLSLLEALARTKNYYKITNRKFRYDDELNELYENLTEKEKKSYYGIISGGYLGRKINIAETVFN